MLTSDWLSHRALLATSALGMALAAAMLSICIQAPPDVAVATISTGDNAGAAVPGCSGTVTVIALVFYVFSFGVGVGPLPFVIVSTSLSLKIRSSGQALATALNWASAFVVTRTFGWLVALLGEAGVFQAYAGISLLHAVLAVRSLPDTTASVSQPQ